MCFFLNQKYDLISMNEALYLKIHETNKKSCHLLTNDAYSLQNSDHTHGLALKQTTHALPSNHPILYLRACFGLIPRRRGNTQWVYLFYSPTSRSAKNCTDAQN